MKYRLFLTRRMVLGFTSSLKMINFLSEKKRFSTVSDYINQDFCVLLSRH